MNLQDRYRGAVIGLACGDALGTTLEFRRPGSFEPLTDMVGGGPFKLQAGQWTDDTSMMLCLGTSLLECKGFDAYDQMRRYTDWYQTGYMSSNGRCFDIGSTTLEALQEFEMTEEPFSGSTDPQTAGNGSLMRLAPIPLAYHNNPKAALEFAELSSKTTHGATVAIDACRFLTALIIGALHEVPKVELLSESFSLSENFWQNDPLCPEIELINNGSYKMSNPPTIVGSGYAAKSLEAALWAFYGTETFEEGCLRSANLGDDADTTAAIYGQLAGAYYGVTEIPEHWRQKLSKRRELESLADKLLALSSKF